MQSDFMSELHRWISKLTARHLQILHQELSFDHHGKGKGNFVQKRSFEKWKKVVTLIDLKEMKTRNDYEIACDFVKRANVVLHVGLCKEIFARKHTATHKPTCAKPFSDHDDTHLTSGPHVWSPAGLLFAKSSSIVGTMHRDCHASWRVTKQVSPACFMHMWLF